MQGLELALARNLLPLEVEVDSKEILELLNSNKDIANNLISDCRYLLDRLGKPTVMHAYREQNGVADRLAKEGCNFDLQSTVHIFEDSPVFTRSVFEQDKSVVQEHVLNNTRPHSSNYNIVNRDVISTSNSMDRSKTVRRTITALNEGASVCNRIQEMRSPSIRTV
ncbi:hypothetical protein A4A49_55190 [Nicotiana attenuata]|uniref:RNase H type-1 domain-containing protein n=1 Tax=Nicotiana attenuata TaxID=49451 RepID=A0A1J6INJ7_NICAT|nr:hypothetical protein A4A49_55190 [Nicotiana attenuata]